MTGHSGTLNLQVDIVSDVVCPWCIIGYLQLCKALDTSDLDIKAEVRWHPFELNPDMSAGGQDLREHLAMKYGADTARSGSVRQRLVELGEKLGFYFDYHEDMRMVNTFRAHQLLLWARESGVQTPLKLALFQSFFSRREDVNDVQVLAEVAARVGLDPADAQRVLASERYASKVREEEHAWRERDVHAVPAFVFQDRYMVPGAQEAETFRRILHKLHARPVA